MAELEVRLDCGLCGESHQQKISMPEGWDSRYRSVSDESAFCPKHAVVSQFAASQCPGCVGGWGDCPLWKSFAYSKLELTADDFSTLETGICPKRVNGTLMVENGKMMEIDLRDSPAAEGGKALAQSIREYAIKYHKRQSGDSD
jgi:hypothetical protein